MAASATKNNGAPAQAPKKKAKGRTESPAPSATGSTPAKATSANPSENHEYENAYLKDLAKNVRNINKKLANVTKTETIVAANKTKSLDELVAAKIINQDQRAQILNKPGLLAKLAEAEDQLSMYRKIHTEYQEQKAVDKKQVEISLAEKTKKTLEEAVAAADARAEKKLRDSLLAISQFLAVAAARRSEEDANPDDDENKALEGCLLQVYHGNDAGVEAMLKISSESTEKTTGVNGDILETTYAGVKQIAAAYAASIYPTSTEPIVTEEQAASDQLAEPAPEAPSADTEARIEPADAEPAAAAAPVTEPQAIQSTDDADEAANGHQEAVEPTDSAPSDSAAANGAVNSTSAATVSEPQVDSPSTNEPGMSQSWVQVPQNPTETEATPEPAPAAAAAAAANAQSWSDEVHEASADTPQPPPPAQETGDDGFTAVQRKNPRDSRGHGHRGRGRGRGGRGDGFGRGRGRGEYRGRGRGGGMSGGRRPDAVNV